MPFFAFARLSVSACGDVPSAHDLVHTLGSNPSRWAGSPVCRGSCYFNHLTVRLHICGARPSQLTILHRFYIDLMHPGHDPFPA